MTLARRIRCRLAVTATLTACFVASSASAAMLATNDFETSFADFTADETLAVLAAYNGDAPSDAASYPFGSFGDKYLSVDTDDATIWRSFAARSADVYFDSYVKFTPMYDEFAHAADAKFVIYLDSATSNLCVISGTAANDRTVVTNRLVSAPIAPNTWGRLTINATSSGGVFAFQVKLNGTLLATSGSVNTFYSLTAGATLSEFGVCGTGALDNFAVRTTDPLFSGTVAATIGGADGEKYASLEEALAEADADTVVSLAADHAGKVYLADAATYKIDPGAYSFGGVVGANGYKVTASEPVAGVTTYTATDAFASQPSPVVLWDGASVNYDFNTLTRTVGANTYTLNLNAQNTVGGSGAYVQIGPNNAQAGVTLTVQNSNPAVTNGFGTAGTVTVIMKCRNMPVTAASNRAIITLMDGEKYKYGGTAQTDNGAVLGMYNSAGTSGWIWKGSTAGMAGLTGDFLDTASGAFTDGEQTIALAYSNTGGTTYYVNGEQVQSNSGLKASTELAATYGVSLGGVDVATGSQFYALTGMQIEAVAVFTSTLTAEQIAAYAFPSSRIAEDIAVSEINAIFGSAGEIWLDVADGVTITGDTTFNASIVHFASAGEVVLYPPASNTATLDFAGVAKPVMAYNGVIPTQSGSTFTATNVPTWVADSAQWTGTVWIKNKTGITASNFNLNDFGNEDSTVRLTKVKGYLKAKQDTSVLSTTYTPAIELFDDGEAYALYLDNGYSYTGSYNEYTIFRELKGSGTLIGADSAAYVLLNVQKWDDFTGTLSLTNKVVAFGSTTPEPSEFSDNSSGVRNGGFIYVLPDATLDIPSSSWYLGNDTSFGNVVVKGTLSYASLDKLSATASVVLRDEGKINVPGTASPSDFANDFAKVSGTGTILLSPSTSSSWIGLPTNNLSTALGVEIAQGSLVVPPDPGNTANATNVFEIGSLSGSGTIQGNYGDYYAYRKLRIVQSTNTVWSGTVNADGYNRLYAFAVAPGATSAGTLTISGNNVNKDTVLEVESGAAVELTGTWKGPVTVNGSLSGTGAITGDLTLAAGATLTVSDAADALSVSGSLTATGAIALALPAGALDGGTCTILSSVGAADLSGATFAATVGGASVDMGRHEVKVVNGQLVLRLIPVKRGTGLLLF